MPFKGGAAALSDAEVKAGVDAGRKGQVRACSR